MSQENLRDNLKAERYDRQVKKIFEREQKKRYNIRITNI